MLLPRDEVLGRSENRASPGSWRASVRAAVTCLSPSPARTHPRPTPSTGSHGRCKPESVLVRRGRAQTLSRREKIRPAKDDQSTEGRKRGAPPFASRKRHPDTAETMSKTTQSVQCFGKKRTATAVAHCKVRRCVVPPSLRRVVAQESRRRRSRQDHRIIRATAGG